jgi:hypothetical protein
VALRTAGRHHGGGLCPRPHTDMCVAGPRAGTRHTGEAAARVNRAPRRLGRVFDLQLARAEVSRCGSKKIARSTCRRWEYRIQNAYQVCHQAASPCRACAYLQGVGLLDAGHGQAP